MSEFLPDLPAAEVDRRLRASLTDLQHAEERAVRWFADMQHRRLYRDLGFGSMIQYAAVRLGFGRSKSYQFLRLAESLRTLPGLRQAVDSGTISWTKAREVAKVATAATEEAWLREAQTSSNRSLEDQVRRVKRRARAAREASRAQVPLTLVETERPEPAHHEPESVPVDLHLRLSPEQYARFEALGEALRKRGERSPREEVLLAGLEALLEERQRGAEEAAGAAECARVHPPRYQVVIQLCEGCETATVATGRGPREITPAELRAALCDGTLERRGGKRRSAIPPRLRRAVLRRDRFRCRAAGCGSARFLAVHHQQMHSRGGTDALENLVTLCAPCHRALHDAEQHRRAG